MFNTRSYQVVSDVIGLRVVSCAVIHHYQYHGYETVTVTSMIDVSTMLGCNSNKMVGCVSIMSDCNSNKAG